MSLTPAHITVEGFNSFKNRLKSLSLFCRCVNSQPIIFTNKQNTKVFQTSKIETFPKDPLLNSTISKENCNDIIRFSIGVSQCSTDCNRNGCTNDRRSCDEIPFRKGQVHGTGLSFSWAINLSIKFSKKPVGIFGHCQIQTMVSIGSKGF